MHRETVPESFVARRSRDGSSTSRRANKRCREWHDGARKRPRPTHWPSCDSCGTPNRRRCEVCGLSICTRCQRKGVRCMCGSVPEPMNAITVASTADWKVVTPDQVLQRIAVRSVQPAREGNAWRCGYCSEMFGSDWHQYVGHCMECRIALCADCRWTCSYCQQDACPDHVPHPRCRRRADTRDQPSRVRCPLPSHPANPSDGCQCGPGRTRNAVVWNGGIQTRSACACHALIWTTRSPLTDWPSRQSSA